MRVDKLRNEQTDRLVAAILSLKNAEECYVLLEDLCTIREIQDLAQRLEVAQMLRRKVTYNEIAQKTGVSTATISRVNRSLGYGAGGYEMVLNRLEQDRELTRQSGEKTSRAVAGRSGIAPEELSKNG